jgi:hypothetical protein
MFTCENWMTDKIDTDYVTLSELSPSSEAASHSFASDIPKFYGTRI